MKRTMTVAVCIIALSLLTFGALNSMSQGRESSNNRGNGNGQKNTLRLLRGTHGYSYSGTVMGMPIAATGPITFDGAGHLSADYNVSLGGEIFQGSFTGIYTVNPDSTGTVTLDLPMLGISSKGSFVIVNNGRETYFSGTDPGVTVTGTTKRQ